MSQLLIIEPHKMLQQALLLALLPEHHVRFAPPLPADATAGEFDAVIVDAAALVETAAPVGQTLATVLDWQVPTVLIEGAQGGPSVERSAVVRLQTPLAKETLRSALAECLSLATAATSDNAAPMAGRPRNPTSNEIVKQRRPKDSALAAENAPALIELVDAIEEDESQALKKN